MPRPSKNPNNPIVRLRGELSKIEGYTVTRAHLAKRTKVPEPTLRDIELGRFGLTHEVAMKIIYATGVAVEALYDEDTAPFGSRPKKPILDLSGNPLSKDSPKSDSLTRPSWFRYNLEATRQLCEAVWEAAVEKKVVRIVDYSFTTWLAEICHTYGLNALLAETLTERLRLGLFDPEYIGYFRPDKSDARNQHEEQTLKKLEHEWSIFEQEVQQEAYRLNDDRPFGQDEERYDACRELALETVIRKRKEAQLKAKPAVKQRLPRRKAA
jgi:DNA-binding XRE family transcriptional regulator